MGKHVDNTRQVDKHIYAYRWWEPQHRKPGEANDTPWPPPRDVWSGNPDTDRAWVHQGLLGRDRGWIDPDSPIEFFD